MASGARRAKSEATDVLWARMGTVRASAPAKCALSARVDLAELWPGRVFSPSALAAKQQFCTIERRAENFINFAAAPTGTTFGANLCRLLARKRPARDLVQAIHKRKCMGALAEQVGASGALRVERARARWPIRSGRSDSCAAGRLLIAWARVDFRPSSSALKSAPLGQSLSIRVAVARACPQLGN